jgi:hypothetical protein
MRSIIPKRGLRTLVAVVLSILVVRFMTTPDMINLLWLPTTVVGVAMAAILPFMIFFFFLQGIDEKMFRKVGWYVISVLYFGLGYMRWDSLGSAGWIYVACGVGALVIAYYDERLRKKLILSRMTSTATTADFRNYGRLTRERRELQETMSEIEDPADGAYTKAKAKLVDVEAKLVDIQKRIEGSPASTTSTT